MKQRSADTTRLTDARLWAYETPQWLGHSDSNLVYYGEVMGHGLVFARHTDACRLGRINWAIDSSTTWGEFASKVPPNVMDELLNEERRVSFEEFCRTWLYQALGWPEQDALNWFRDCMEAYRVLDPDERYPLPEEQCWANDVRADGSWPEFPPRLALRWCPREIISEFGERRVPLHELPYICFHPTHILAILASLEACGFELIRADRLVQIACGCGPHDLSSEVARSLIEAAERRELPDWAVHEGF
jgi:hypothetical protein